MTEKIKLPAKLAKNEPNQQVLVQAVQVYLGNQRKAKAKTKTRGEVNKTTAKMYKQKGTGRARHGAYSAPIFVGGGIAFGPTGEQNYKRKLSKEQAKLAMVSALITKSKEMWTITGIEKIKNTKEAGKELGEISESKLVILGSKELKLNKYFRNLEKVTVTNVNTINTYQIMKYKQLLFTEAAWAEMTKKYVD